MKGENNGIESRRSWIDVAKGIGIFVIVLGHSILSSSKTIYSIIYSFNSVLFFLLSGITFCNRENKNNTLICFDDRGWKTFLLQKWFSLGIPYFSWSFISILLYYFFGKITASQLNIKSSNFSIIKNVLGCIYGNSNSIYFEWNRPLWFIPCLFLVQLIWFFVLKQLKNKKRTNQILIITMTLLISLVWMIVLSEKQIYLVLPFEFETAICMLFYFGIGLLFNSFNFADLIKKYSSNKLVSVLVLSITILITIYLSRLNSATDLRTDHFGNIYLYIPCALFGCGSVLLFSIFIKQNGLFEYLGRNSLSILLMHKFPLMIIRIMWSILHLDITLYSALIMASMTIIVCLFAKQIIMKIAPRIIGER